MTIFSKKDFIGFLLSCQLSNYSYYKQQMNVSPTIWDYSQSNINETLLLQSTEANFLQKIKPNQLPSLFREFKEAQTIASRQKSLVFDFCSQLSVTVNSNVKQNEANQQPHEKIEDLYNICSNLMSTLQKLQTKIQKMEEKDSQRNSFQRETLANASQNDPQSILAYSNLQNTKICKCQHHSHQKSVANNMYEGWQFRQNLQTYKQKNQSLKKQILRLQIVNEQLKKSYKKMESQNSKLRELLKQYQSFNKKLITQRQSDHKLQRNCSSKLLTERQFTQSKTNPYKSQQQYQASQYHISNVCYQADYYADKIGNSSKSRKKQTNFDQIQEKGAFKQKEASTFAQIQRKNNMHSEYEEEKTYLKSFQQCKKSEPLGNFIGNMTPVNSKYSNDFTPKSKNPLSFYGLRQKGNHFGEFQMKQNQSPLKQNPSLSIRQKQRH